MSDRVKHLFVFGQYQDGQHVDVSDGTNDILVRVPRDMAESVCKWADERAQEHFEDWAELCRLRRVIESALDQWDRESPAKVREELREGLKRPAGK